MTQPDASTPQTQPQAPQNTGSPPTSPPPFPPTTTIPPPPPHFSLSSLHIAPYTPDKQPQILDLFISGMLDNKHLLPTKSLHERLYQFMHNAISGLKSIPPTLDIHLVLAPPNHTVVAMAGLSRTQHDQQNHCAELTRISVARDWRGNGLGRLIISHLIRKAVHAWQVHTVYLSTARFFVGPIRLYERLGFRFAGNVNESDVVVKYVMDVREHTWWKE